MGHSEACFHIDVPQCGQGITRDPFDGPGATVTAGATIAAGAVTWGGRWHCGHSDACFHIGAPQNEQGITRDTGTRRYVPEAPTAATYRLRTPSRPPAWSNIAGRSYSGADERPLRSDRHYDRAMSNSLRATLAVAGMAMVGWLVWVVLLTRLLLILIKARA